MASASPVTDVEEEAQCPICLEFFTDPVTLDCGHNFCQGCITQHCDKWEDLGDLECPVCRDRIKGRNFRSNWQLANIAESLRHKNKHLCAKHKKELNLFCKDDDTLLCMTCWKVHASHTVRPLEDTAQEYKENIQEQLQSLQKKREELEELKVAEEQRSQECLKQLEKQKQEITSVFKEMHKFLEKQERVWLMQLAGLEKKIKERQEENMTRLSEEISRFRDLIKDVEEMCQQPPCELLQDIRRIWGRCQEGQVRQQLQLPPGLQWKRRSASLKITALQKAMEELKGSLKQTLGKVSVTLDPDTASSWLVLSEDLKSMRCRDTYRELPDNPERFDYRTCVLGQESFTSGSHCWEVEVEKLSERERWAVGVARESVKRKGVFILSPDEGIWAVGKDSSKSHLVSVVTFPKWTLLTLNHEPRKIRVFLDYEEGCVEFFDADTDNLIFTFAPGSFSGEGIRPFFEVTGGVCLKC